MRILRLGLCIGMVWSASQVMAASLDEADILHRAEFALQEGEARRDNPQQARLYFLEAAHGYEALDQLGIQNPALLRNEGNAYLLAGDLPRAILAYRRGLRLAPADAVLQANLRYAREQVDLAFADGFGQPPIDHWPPWLPRPSLAALMTLTVLVYTAGLAVLTRWWMTRGSGMLAIGVGLFVAALAPLFGAIHEAREQRQEAKHPLVVVAANHVQLRNGDGLAYPARYDGKTLNRGVEARLLFERGDWLHIEAVKAAGFHALLSCLTHSVQFIGAQEAKARVPRVRHARV
jgi:tetratricopeptide (TPR) repeat protein